MTAPGSSSSATSSPELDLTTAGRLAEIPTALVTGTDRQVISPLRFLPSEELPTGPPPTVDRAALAAALASANAAYGHRHAEALGERLADPATRVVVTGQQPGLWGGPLLTLTKALAAVAWVEALEASGQPAVALFWVATEDHDWDEVAQATFFDKKDSATFDLGPDADPLLPVGMRTFGPGLEEMETRLPAAATAALPLLRRWYRPQARFGEAFSRLLVHLMGERAPLFLDSMLPEMKDLQRPWMRRLVGRRQAVSEALATSHERVKGKGYKLQVRPQPGTSPLFLLHGKERRRIEWVGDDAFTLRGLEERGLEEGFPRPVEDLLATIEENPSVVSPGVLARPIVQDAVLGTTLQIMGPAELSYLAQIAPLYDVLGVEAPHTTLRPQIVVAEERHLDQIDELGVTLPEVMTKDLDRLLADRLGEDFVSPVRQRLEQELDSLRQPTLALDPTLERPLRKTRDQIGRAFDQLTGKVAAAVSRRNEVWRRRLQKVRDAALPGDHPQERSLSLAHFVARYGEGFVDIVRRQLRRDHRILQQIRIAVAPVAPVIESEEKT